MHSQRLKQQKLTKMEAVKQKSYDLDSNIVENPIIDPNWREKPMRAWDEVYEELCHEVGTAYGLNDIREA